MKLTDEKEISWWAYHQCLKNDTKQMRNLITDSEHCYCYCRFVNRTKSNKRLIERINNNFWKTALYESLRKNETNK